MMIFNFLFWHVHLELFFIEIILKTQIQTKLL